MRRLQHREREPLDGGVERVALVGLVVEALVALHFLARERPAIDLAPEVSNELRGTSSLATRRWRARPEAAIAAQRLRDLFGRVHVLLRHDRVDLQKAGVVAKSE